MKFITLIDTDKITMNVNVSHIVFFAFNDKTKQSKIVLSNGGSFMTKSTPDEINMLIAS